MFHRPHARVTLDTGDVMITKQSHKKECDIHNILKQYQRTGIINHINSNRPAYMDLPDNIDYQESYNTILKAQEAFASLPAKVRDHFSNDPAQFLAAFSDSKAEAILREFGLLEPVQKGGVPSGTPLPAPSDQSA